MDPEQVKRFLWHYFAAITGGFSVLGAWMWFWYESSEEPMGRLISLVGASLLSASLVGLIFRLAQFYHFIREELRETILESRFLEKLTGDAKMTLIERTINSLTRINSPELIEIIKNQIVNKVQQPWRDDFEISLNLIPKNFKGTDFMEMEQTTCFKVINMPKKKSALFPDDIVCYYQLDIMSGLQDLQDDELYSFEYLKINGVEKQPSKKYHRDKQRAIVYATINYHQDVSAEDAEIKVEFKEISKLRKDDFLLVNLSYFTKKASVIVTHPNDIKIDGYYSYTGNIEETRVDREQKTSNLYKISVDALGFPGNGICITWRG